MSLLPEGARRLCRVTPLVDAPALGCALKLESLQRTGSFKLRGAALRLASLTDDERRRGVVAASAGNHGQGVALAARALGIAAQVIVPETTPRVKRDAIAALGAQLSVAGRNYDLAEAEARAIAARTGAVFVSPFDDELVIAGNGRWLGEELLAQRPDTTTVVVPVGGGGLVGGLAAALAGRGVSIIGVQPAANCAMHDSLASGRALTVYDGGHTRCEGLEGPVAERTFALARDHGVRVVLVDEAAILAAMAFAYRALGLCVEPSAAVGIAALRAGLIAPSPRTVVLVTGSNVEPEQLDEALTATS
jgi:threonine dehydratase